METATSGCPGDQGPLSPQQIHRLSHIVHPQILRQGWILLRNRFIHCICDVPVREVPSRAGTQL